MEYIQLKYMIKIDIIKCISYVKVKGQKLIVNFTHYNSNQTTNTCRRIVSNILVKFKFIFL